MSRRSPNIRRAGTSWPEEWVNWLRDLWAEGLSYTVIAKRMEMHFGVPFKRGQIAGKADRMKLERRTEKPQPVRKPERPRRARLQAAARRSERNQHGEDVAMRPVQTKPAEHAPPAIDEDDLPEPGVDIMALGPKSCRWPIDPAHRLRSWRFCGAQCDPRSTLSPYCTQHWQASLANPRRVAARPIP